ncbi:hypothetical protein ES703_71166 [subsurface metagenome]
MYPISSIIYISIPISISSSSGTTILIVISALICLFSRSSAPLKPIVIVISNASPSASPAASMAISISNWYVLMSSSDSNTPSIISWAEGSPTHAAKEKTTTSTRAIGNIFFHISALLSYDVLNLKKAPAIAIYSAVPAPLSSSPQPPQPILQ